jgi:hypothetical protein
VVPATPAKDTQELVVVAAQLLLNPTRRNDAKGPAPKRATGLTTYTARSVSKVGEATVTWGPST